MMDLQANMGCSCTTQTNTLTLVEAHAAGTAQQLRQRRSKMQSSGACWAHRQKDSCALPELRLFGATLHDFLTEVAIGSQQVFLQALRWLIGELQRCLQD